MCGIFGVLHRETSGRVSEAILKDMGHTLSHRGPDNLGIWSNGNVGLGHTRLSIIDLSPAANQPISNEDGSVHITFNGEIYNFKELRETLIKKGHRFRSNTDSEVIVHLWEEEGVKCVERLRGMFAFAIWDSKDGSLFLARDRVGKKPLFYIILKNKILFASEIKAIMQDPDFVAEPDIEAIHHYLSYQSVPSPYCAFKGVKKLPPAHYILFKSGKGTPKRYWKLSYRDKLKINGEKDIEALKYEIIERFREAVRLRLVSDVPVGAFLSGGLDSSMVVALMAGLMNQPVKTFSIGFKEDEYNELPYAREVAKRYNTDHHEHIVTPDAKNILPDLIWHYNEPFADSSAVPTYYVSKLAREHVKVILTGDGGDENFAGYPRYLNEGEFAVKRDFPSLLRRWLLRKKYWVSFISRNRGVLRNFARLSSLTQRRLLYYYRITHFNEIMKLNLYTPDMMERTSGIFSVDVMLDKYRNSDADNFLDSTLDLDFSLYLPDTLMVKVDVASMAHSLECRSPLLDHEFMEFVAKIPHGLKLKGGVETKHIFKLASEPHLPHDIIYREKMGFGVPLDHWFRKDLKEMAYDTLLSKRAIERGYFKKEFIEKILDKHQQGENWHYHIWNLLMLELWHLMFIDKTMPPPSAR